MYKVYQDPEGTRCVEKNHPIQITNKKSSTIENENTYKRRIESLNEEIKVLNDELNMVCSYLLIALLLVCVYI